MRLVLIGDIHLYSLKVHPRRLLGKRVIGHMNLLLNRRRVFNHGLLEPMLSYARTLKPDWALFSGDFTTTSLRAEFEDVQRYIRPLLDEMKVCVVPGNHDRYTFRSKRTRRVETVMEGLLPPSFPHLTELKPGWKLLALDSAIPQVVFSRGALGREQLGRAIAEIDALPPGETVMVLNHYPVATPPWIPKSWSHDLAEERELREALERCQARVIYIHGHIHRPWLWTPGGYGAPSMEETGAGAEPVAGDKDAKDPPFMCINAGSPCMMGAKYPMGQGFWEMLLPDDPAGRPELIHHVPQPKNGNYGVPRLMSQSKFRPGGEPAWQARRVL